MINVDISVAGLVAILAAVTSLVFEFFPFVKSWFENLSAEQKRAYNAYALLAIVAVLFGGVCGGLFVAEGFACDVPSAWQMLVIYLQAIAVNQGVHKLFKRKA